MNLDLVIGLDEAGRGPMLGPMVLAVVALPASASRKLKRKGVTDSKKFSGPDAHAKRTDLAGEILAVAEHAAVAVADTEQIDDHCRQKGLNRLEQAMGARLLRAAPRARRIVCDGKNLFSPLKAEFAGLEAHNHGEDVHVAVAAASILAKVRRDELWRCIAQRYAPVFGETVHQGGGYVNAATRRFVSAYVRRHRRLPPEARKTWPWEFLRAEYSIEEWTMIVPPLPNDQLELL